MKNRANLTLLAGLTAVADLIRTLARFRAAVLSAVIVTIAILAGSSLFGSGPDPAFAFKPWNVHKRL